MGAWSGGGGAKDEIVNKINFPKNQSLSKKQFIWLATLLGTLIPIAFLAVNIIFRQFLKSSPGEIYFFLMALLWPYSLPMMALDYLDGFNKAIGLLMLFSINSLYYSFLGWILWMGKSISKWFYPLFIFIVMSVSYFLWGGELLLTFGFSN
ncbi:MULTISPECIES: hypothetical protein [unclassified Nitrospina]|uniref:hypothetical protein n=1 Tax=unclassified Nitrospina TaxID=2638683 RepID=UPI003F98F4ED